MKEITVVCAVIYQDDYVFIAKRSSLIANEIWEFPGGKVEANETKEHACIREIQEELAVTIEIDTFICDVIDNNFDPPVHVYAYAAHIVCGKIHLQAHSQAIWIHPKDVFNYQFQEADEKIKELIQ